MDCEASQMFVKKKTVKKHKTSKRKKKSDSSHDEAVDLSEKIFPIVHFINDREEMIKQVFSVMEKEKLNCMLPPILKGMTVSSLKENCLKELRNMSDDEVRKVLCGECIETTNIKVSAPVKIDSDSSGSSVEECHSEEQEKRTLLDILEQEMQEIAYNTVLKRDKRSPEIQSDDGLAEVVAITPTHSPSKPINNVPLIFIDSEDEEPCAQPSEPLAASKRCAALNENKIVNGDVADMSRSVSKDKVTINIVDNSNSEAGGLSLNNNWSCSTSLSPSETCSKKSQETFVIQVFSSKTSPAERVVKKIYKSSFCGKDLDRDLSVNKKMHLVDSVVIDSEGLVENKGNLTNHSSQEVDQEVSVIEKSEEVVCIDENITSLCQSSSKQLDPVCDPTLMFPLVETCTDLNRSNMPANAKTNENIAESPQLKEKEEGEITEEESEEGSEVLQTQDAHQSPTIFLSSDSDVKSDLERPESRGRGHKHHHRHRRNKRSTESPERSRRRIDKRGNRSYRRKPASSVKETLNCIEKEEEVFERNKDTPEEVTIAVSPNAHVKTPSAAQDSEESSKLEIEEETEIENIQTASSPNTLEIHISDTKLDSSEETEISNVGEPMSTKTSWADRWAEKKDMKKVVITSKICRNVRKKILSDRRKQSNQEPASTQVPVLPPVPPLVLHVEGSVQEYQMLQLLVSDSDVCDDQHTRSDKETDVSKEPILNSLLCEESQVNNNVQEANQPCELTKSELNKQEITNEIESS